MRKLTRIWAFFLAATLSLSLCGVAAGTEVELPPPAAEQEQEQEQETAVVIDRLLPVDVAFLPLLALGSDGADVLPQTVDGMYGRFSAVACPVTWDTQALTAPGRQLLSGTVSAPEGYALQAGAGLEHVTVPVAVYEEAPVVFFGVPDRGDAPYHGTVLLAQGGEAAAVLPYETLDLVSLEGDWLRVPAQWDLTGLDADRVGRYTVYADPVLPQGAGLLEPDARVAQDVYVMEETAVDLGAYNVGVHVIICSWLTTIDPQQAVLECSADGAQWFPIETVMPEVHYQLSEQFLELNTSSLEVGTECYFRIVYQNRSDGVLHVVLSDTNVPTPDWDGDRDGGDAGGLVPDGGETGQPPTPGNGNGSDNNAGSGNDTGDNDGSDPGKVPESGGDETGSGGEPGGDEPSPELNPVPDAPSVPLESTPPESKQPAAVTPPPAQSKAPAQSGGTDVPVLGPPAPEMEEVQEVFGETWDLISGTRLLRMLETTGEARFTKQGVTVCLSAQALQAQQIQAGDSVSITIAQEAGDTVFLAVSINDAPLSALPDTHLMVPYRADAADTAMLLTDEQGEEIAKGTYDAALAVVSFRVDGPGRFTIREQTASPQSTASAVSTQSQTQPGGTGALWLLLPLGGAMLAAWIWLKRGRRA